MSVPVKTHRLSSGPLTLAFGVVAALCLLAATALPPGEAAPLQESAAAPLDCTVADGFTLSSVGDVIMALPESRNPEPAFQAQLKVLRQADAVFGNFEGTAIDIRNFKGYPQAESGGAWLVDNPGVVNDLKNMGFTIMNRANNHTTDWGVEGMAETDRELDRVGIVHAGTGKDLASARAPSYLESSKGRVALVGITSTFEPMEAAADPTGAIPGRPGADMLRTTRWVLVTPETMQALVKVSDSLPGRAARPSNGTPQQLVLFGTRYRVSDHPGIGYDANPADMAAIIRNVREGKESSDFEIVTMHNHESGAKSNIPPDFTIALAHAAIDNGADVFIGHGPHQLRGIEIYRGKPIFYSLGNYFFGEYQQQVIPAQLYGEFNVDPNAAIPAEFEDNRTSRGWSGNEFWTSVIAVSTYARGRVSEIRLYPIDLGIARRWSLRGIPWLASPEVARTVLARLQELSKPFGTTIEIQGSVGIIHPAP